MGTNYYVKSEVCEYCNRSDEDLHIGKSSAGWCFSLRVYPDMNIHNLDDWKQYLNSIDNVVEDEYGDIVSFDKLMSTITERSWKGSPDNLLRHDIDDRHCIGHGNGTYDYMIGDFS